MNYITLNPSLFMPTKSIGRGANAKPIKCRINKTGCWEVISHKINKTQGYFIFGRSNNYKHQQFLLHRCVYEYFNGEIPNDMEIRHTCDNPRCINPKHLIIGTHTENMHDMIKRNRAIILKGEKHGMHKLTTKQVREIRADKTTSQRKLGKKYGVHNSTIWRVRNNLSWKSLHGCREKY